MRFWLAFGLGLAGLGCAGVRAETLPVEGLYAAGTDAPSRARSIAIAGFAGRGGERLAFAIDSALRGAVVEGSPWFDISFSAPPRGVSYTYDADADPAASRGGADAVMRGIAEIEVRDIDSGTKEVEECVARANGQCTEKKKVSYRCRARNVTMRPELRLVSREGDLLYAKSDTLAASRRFCEDEERTPPVDSMIAEMAGTFAGVVRSDLAPTWLAQDIRVLESRDGIAKEDRDAFRAAVRLTKTDVPGACRAFAALEPNNPRDISILFNIGLCREGAGDLEAAEDAYRGVLAIRPGKAEAVAGLERVASRFRAERQFSLRYGAEAR